MASTTEKKCNICEKYFPDQIFVAHKILHFEDKFHPCNKNCGKVFTFKTDLLKHYCDGEKKSYECDICKKALRGRISLSAHKRIHRGENPYECNICKKAFSSGNRLTNHKRVHTGEKPYECGFCRKAFSSSSNLTKHTRLHTGEKPFSCDICQKYYADSSGLSLHNKTVAHLERMKSMNRIIPLTQSSILECGKSIKEEDIKEEINEEESVDNPLIIYHEIESRNVYEDIKKETTPGESDYIVTEIKEEGIDDDTLFVQEIHYSDDGENNTVVDIIDIVEHKIKTDI